MTLKIDDAREIPVSVILPPGSIVKYSGGGQGVVYDRHWKVFEVVPLSASELRMGPGRHRVGFGCRFLTADQPQVKLEFRTVGEAQTLVRSARSNGS
jgi:hypothetical protein